MPTTWTIAIDWDRDGIYTGLDDITAHVISAEWVLGMQQAYQDAADNSVLKLVLNNVDKRFSPENTVGPLYNKLLPFRPVRVLSNDGTTTRKHWVGWIESIQPSIGKNDDRQATLIATGPMQFLKATETRLPLQEFKRSDEIIDALLKEVVFPPVLSQAWIVGVIGNSELGSKTYLTDTSAYSTLDEGKLRVGIAADNWVIDGLPANAPKNTFDVYQAIKEITAAEHGKFLFDRDGRALFWNRHHLLQGGTAVATFNDAMTNMNYSYANLDNTKNEIVVICHPRTVSAAADVVLWKFESIKTTTDLVGSDHNNWAEAQNPVIRIEPNQSYELYAKYEDEQGKRTGAREVNISELVFESGNASVVLDPKATGVAVKFTNPNSVAAIVTKLVIRGKKISDAGDIEVRSTDTESLVRYGRRTLRMNLPSIDRTEQAQYIADFERDRRGKPYGAVDTIDLVSHGRYGGAYHTQQLQRTIGDLIAVSETQSGHGQTMQNNPYYGNKYYVIGEHHTLTNGTTKWNTTWFLEPCPSDVYSPWKLGVTGRSELPSVEPPPNTLIDMQTNPQNYRTRLTL